jgi:hypothetical protein
MTRLYGPGEMAAVPWPADAEGEYARRVLPALVDDGVRPYIANVHAEVRVLVADGTILPVVLNDVAPPEPSSYVVSPTSHYVRYGKREIELELANPLARAILPPLLDLARPLLAWGDVERVVYVNNWLLSTNLYPPLARATLAAARDALVAAFPDRAVVFRSVNERLGGELRAELGALGFGEVFSRQLYLWDPATAGKPSRGLRQDINLAARSADRWVDAGGIADAEIPRLTDIYADLYLRKYSPLNPRFTERFVARALRDGWLRVRALRSPGGRIDAAIGWVERGGVMTAPFIGYDRAEPVERGLYRRISLELMEEARRGGLLLNQSSGAAAFKRYRGATPALEFSLVFDAHLPRRRRLPWALLASLSRRALVPMARRMKF